MQLLWMCCVFWAVLVNGNTTDVETKPSLRHNDWRLPRSLVPRHYRVRLLPYLKEGNFTTDGHVEILVECKEETDLIILHMADISIVSGSLQVQDFVELRPVRIKSYAEDRKRQFLIITTRNETLTMGKFYKISMDFVGQLNDKLNGFYRSSYIENGVRKYLATTQFSPTDARRAFPCFDEPVMKARFQITLGRHQSKTATSNMPLKKTTPHESLEEYVWDEFETTLPMSTYVLAFIVSDFQGIDSPPELSHVHFRIWSRPSAANQTEYARYLGPKILDYFETFFNISFPLPKLDMFAIPDFAVGAMENWGLITYRETALLYDPKKSAAYNRQRVAIVIAHELAHQWFGNLVTMEWWSDLWLKEGFASYLEYVAVDAVEPSLNTMLQFTVEDTQSVFSVDALTTSHPMSVPVSKRNEVNEVFDSIPYSKGPAVIRMLAGFLGEKTFRGGLTLYLNKKKYQNAVQDDLWEAMNEQTIADEVDLPTDVKTIMDSWSLLTGYPIVTVDRNYENYTAYISQERFFLLSDVSSRDKSLWWIPLTFTKDFNSIYLSWLLGNETLLELDLPDVEADQWILFNVEQVGYYRVNYDMNNWHLISQQLRSNHEKISILNRAQIMDDAFNIARTGQLVYGVPFELSRYLRLEKEFTPWKSALAALRYLDAMLYETPAKKNFRSYLKWLIQPAFDHVGFVERMNDTHLTTLNRNQILSWACKLGIPECVDNAAALYAKWMDDPDNDGIIGPNQKLVVTCAAIANGASTQWDFAYQRYLTTNLASEKETLLKALSCSKDTAILSKLLEWTMNSTSGIRRQDTLNIMSSVAANPVGQSMVFDFVVSRWDEMVKSFPSLYVLGRLVDSITLTLSSPSQLQHLKEMSQGKRGDLGTAARSIEHALERTRINVDWKSSYYKTVDALMASWYEAFQGQ